MELLLTFLVLAVAVLCALVIVDHRRLRELEAELGLEACRTRDLEIALRHQTPPRPPRWVS